mgnify:FL=1
MLHSQLLTICVELMASLPCAPPLSGNPSDTRHSTQDQRSQAPSTQDSGTGDSVDETLTMSQPREPPAPLHPSQIRQRSGLMVEVGGTPTGSQRTPQSEGGGGDDAGSSIGSNTSASASASSSRGSTASLTMSESVLNRIQARRNQKGRGAALSPWYKSSRRVVGSCFRQIGQGCFHAVVFVLFFPIACLLFLFGLYRKVLERLE